MSQALYRKWRPQTWDAVIGQDHVVQTLRNALISERVAHAYLFAGPRGTGKTTTARLLAKAVNCQQEDLAQRPCNQCDHCQAVNTGRFMDLIEIDAASNTSVDDVRDLREKINFAPNQGKFKVYIIDEVHMLSTAAFNALLKTLEEPPSHAIFILATTEVHKIPATVLSRCQRHEFRRIPVPEIVAFLNAKAQEEGIQVEQDALKLIARQSTGAMRDAISLLDQLASTGRPIDLQLAQDILGAAASQSIVEMIDALVRRNAKNGLDCIHLALDSGSDARQFARQTIDYLRSLLLIHTGNADQIDATPEMRSQMARHVQALSIPQLLGVLRAFNTAANDASRQSIGAWQPALSLELAYVETLSLLDAPQVGSTEGVSVAADQERTAARAAARIAPPSFQSSAAIPVAPQQTAPTPSQVNSGESGSLTFKDITDRWRQVANLVRQESPQTEALLRSGKLLGVKDGAIFFGLSSEVLKSRMEKSENLDLVIKALQQVFGVAIPFRCIVYTGKTNSLPPDIDSNGMVAAAIRDLGGEIVDIQ